VQTRIIRLSPGAETIPQPNRPRRIRHRVHGASGLPRVFRRRVQRKPGHGSAYLSRWVVAMLFTAGSYLLVSRIYSLAGSVFIYSARTLGDTVGFLAGWAMLLDYLLLPTLVYVTSAIAMHAVVPEIPKSVWIVGFMAINTLANLRGIETTARMSLVFL